MKPPKRPKAASTTSGLSDPNSRIGLSPESLRESMAQALAYAQGRNKATATKNDLYTALAFAVRERLLHRSVHTMEASMRENSRMVCYLSAEFLIGPQLGNNLVNLGILEAAEEAVQAFGVPLAEILEQEDEPGLGNGGLGRLAACYLDSMATLEIPAIGYGIRYEYGIFDQTIKDGWQVEITDRWLRLGNPWEISRPEVTYEVRLGGHTEAGTDETGRYRVQWIPARVIRGIAYDTPVLGYRVNTCNQLRLWRSAAAESFNFAAFNRGDYAGAVQEKIVSENISKVLYPNDESPQGKQLRLEQQYFFVSCSLQDMIRIHLERGKPIEEFAGSFAAQLNDTHPAVGIAELMRLLVDDHGLSWETSWDITRKTFGYTNHTLLPEAMEKWPVGLFAYLLPRHLEIIYEINSRFLEEVKSAFPGDGGRMARLSLIDEAGERYVRMANLACVGSHAINGVAALHSELLKQFALRDFAELWPDRFSNKTNGVTPRRFLLFSNPGLSALITRHIGDKWVRHLGELRKLEPLAKNPAFQKEWQAIKLENKRRLATLLKERTGVTADPTSLFDVQVKRIHEYKRQHLNVLHIAARYLEIKRNPSAKIPARTFILGGKAAPGYAAAKLIIKLIHSVGEVASNDPDTRNLIKVAFFPDFSVKNGQRIYPAADLSEQISTAGKEASGTGNMKFSMNGALTIGTLDGANIEIREEVGADNFFLFGLTAAEVQQRKESGYHPRAHYEQNERLREVLDAIRSGVFSPSNPGLFHPLVDELLHHDTYMLLADFADYIECQRRVDQLWMNPSEWTRQSILNVARIGKFSSDRAIQEYCDEIWNATALPVTLPD